MSLNEKLKKTSMKTWPDKIYAEMRLYWPPDEGIQKYSADDYEEIVKESFRRIPDKNRFISTGKHCGRPIILRYDENLDSFVVRKKYLLAADFVGQKTITEYSTDSFLAFITYISGTAGAPSSEKPPHISEIIHWRDIHVIQAVKDFNRTLTWIDDGTQRRMAELRQYHEKRKGEK